MEEKDTKTVTMPLHEYRQLVQNANQTFIKTYGYTKETLDEQIALNENLRKSADFHRDKYFATRASLDSCKEVIRILNEKVSDLEKELNGYKQRKWWQFWKC